MKGLLLQAWLMLLAVALLVTEGFLAFIVVAVCSTLFALIAQ